VKVLEDLVMTKALEMQMILIAGPYRSGTNDDPALIKKNVRQMSVQDIFQSSANGWRCRWSGRIEEDRR
jgi:hypothetical protein